MTRDEIRALALRHLAAIAPDGDLATLSDTADVRETIDLDSLDFLRWISAIHKETGVAIPESDYRRVTTLASLTEYLATRLP